MKRSSLVTVAASCGVAALFLAASAQAQVTKEDAKCRSTAQKSAGKLASTANKAVIGCIKGAVKSGSPSNCTDPTAADAKGKIGGARTKLIAAVGGSGDKCGGVLPPSYVHCPSPGTTGAIGSVADVGTCLADVVEPTSGRGMVENFWVYILDADLSDPIWGGKVEGKCINSIAKNAGKLYDTVVKTLGGLQASSDKSGGSYNVSVDRNDDSKGKIGKAEAKLSAAIAKDCGPASQEAITALRSCSSDVNELDDCIAAAARKNASGVNSTSFEMSGECPAQVDVFGTGTFFANGAQSRTTLNVGQLGLGHNAEIPEGFSGAVNLSCSDGSCSSCSVSASCAQNNCRCSNNPTIQCSTPFGADAACGGNTCNVFFGPPLPLNAGGAFTCVVNRIPFDLVGTADIGTGSSSTSVANSSDVYLTGTQSRPCPVCEGDPTPNDGAAGGTCSGGQQNGGACDANFVNPVFGNTSYDCQPTTGQSVATLSLEITLGDAPLSKSSGVVCTTGDPANCPCNVCSDDPTQACDDNADCAGNCNSAGPGAPTVSNGCNTLNCGADGLCADGTTNGFCDGFVKQSGGGIIGCSDDTDCTALNPECPGGNCGLCTLNDVLPCFPNPIVNNSGRGGQDGAILTAQFCTPPTGTGVDLAAGTPGAADLTIEWDFIGRCANGDEFELGGNNCTP